ncbi:hypothetical protein OPIT5_14660 [Opitutaceae bacterium TAV5]|nr:hypothetical protein OPIT5_14660 [Opitutaceae bacterium TAV5]
MAEWSRPLTLVVVGIQIQRHINLPEIGNAHGVARPLADAADGSKYQAGQYSDDGNHREQFDQRESCAIAGNRTRGRLGNRMHWEIGMGDRVEDGRWHGNRK